MAEAAVFGIGGHLGPVARASLADCTAQPITIDRRCLVIDIEIAFLLTC